MNIENSRVLISQEQLQARVKELGQRITADYSDKERPLLVGIMKGVHIFFADLVRNIDLDVEVSFIKASSYGDGTVSSGHVKVTADEDFSVKGRHVILVDELIDTGITLDALKKQLMEQEPASLEICTCLSKPERRERDVNVRYLGFETENVFLVGYGMDKAGHYRNLPYVGVIETREEREETV